MATAKSFFRFSVDETSLHDFFSSAEEKFNKYDAIISQQNAKIEELSKQNREIKEKMERPNEALITRINDLNTKMVAFEKDFSRYESKHLEIEKRISKIESEWRNELVNLESKITDAGRAEINQARNAISATIDEKISNLQGLFNSSDKKNLEDILNTKNVVEQGIDNLRKEICELQVQITSSVGALAESVVDTTEKVKKGDELKTKQISDLNDTISSLKSDIETLKLEVNKPLPVRPPPYNLDSVHPKPMFETDVKFPPQLPKLEKFGKIEQLVSYIYDLIPNLQSILTQSYDQMNNGFSKTENDWMDVKQELHSLRNSMSEMATREEVSLIMKRKSHSMQQQDIGGSSSIKCIACGRDLARNDEPQYPMQRRIGTAVGGVRRMTVGVVDNQRVDIRSARSAPKRKLQIPK